MSLNCINMILGRPFSFIVYLSLFFFFLLPIQAESVEFRVQSISSLDSINRIDGINSEAPWYITNRMVDPEKFLESIQKSNPKSSDIFQEEWREYFPPVSAFKNHPDWEGSQHLSYFKLLSVPEDWDAPHISIRLGVISDKDIVYFNNHKIGSHGNFGNERPEGYDKVRIYRVKESFIKKGEVNTILILNESYFPYTAGIEQDEIKIGPSTLIEGEFFRDEYIKIFLLMVYTTVGAYFLFLFLRRRKDYENLFFGLFTIFLVFYQLLRNQLKYELGVDFLYLKKTEYLVLMTLVPLLFHFIRSYFSYPYHWVFKIADGIICGAFLVILFSQSVILYDFINKNIIQILWIVYLIATFTHLGLQAKKKNLDAILILAGFVFLILAAVLDVLSTRNIIVLPRMVGYAFILFILSIATILANKFVRLNIEVEELNSNLEKKVEERTEELNQSLDTVQKLKVQQDGDYFLTSLLLNPLITNNAKSGILEIDFFTKQKKDFEFKGKKHEIGGDISISSNIELKNKRFTVFINGDAMGKSMQGAGGALVLGVVFNAVLTRSNAESNKNKHPEIWLKETFMDLQRVFESFNGSMLISIVLGLVEEDTGILYYINAEHPWTVLYRDGKASFLENELVLRKLGFPGNEESFFVRTFQLQPGDVLVAGSDGRDDILLGHDENGIRIINEDEEVFVKVVEEGESQLLKIVSILESKGEYTDDITLIRVQYNGLEFDHDRSQTMDSEKPIFNQALGKLKNGEIDAAQTLLEESILTEPVHLENTYNLLGQTFFKKKEWEKSLEHFEKSLEILPASSDVLFYASYSAKMAKKLLKASDLGERCYLRNPGNLKNLINLADIYKKLGKKERAIHLTDKALKESPENENALRLKNILTKTG